MRLDSGCDELPCWAGFRGVEGDEGAHHETQFVCEEQWPFIFWGWPSIFLGRHEPVFLCGPPFAANPVEPL